MKKSIVFGTLFLFFFGFLLLPTLHALTYQHEGSYPDTIILYPPQEYEEKKGERILEPVPFDHDVHDHIACDECHHYGTVRDGCMETGCHDVAVEEDLNDRDRIYYFEEAYHEMCMGCHIEEKDKGAPVLCNDCHIR